MLSLIDLREKIVLLTEFDDLCDKLQSRASELGGIVNLVDRRRPSLGCLALIVHLSRAELITRLDDRYAMAKFSKSGVWSEVPEGSALIFEIARISL